MVHINTVLWTCPEVTSGTMDIYGGTSLAAISRVVTQSYTYVHGILYHADTKLSHCTVGYSHVWMSTFSDYQYGSRTPILLRYAFGHLRQRWSLLSTTTKKYYG